VSVSQAELKAYYEANPIRFQHPESFTFQTISIMAPEKATAEQLNEQKMRAQEALRQAKSTKSSEEFGLLAEKISDDDYRVMMGQHKPIPVDQLAPQVVKALLAMKNGDVSDLLQVGPIYTVIRLQGHTLAGKQSFEEVKAQLEKELPKTKKEQLRESFNAKLHQNAKIEVL
jgi:parvulin-like peptidyl-prolyl isomerase